MLNSLDHACDPERGESCATILDVLYLQADARQRISDLLERGVSVEVRLQPGQSELHASGSRGAARRPLPPAPLPQGEGEFLGSGRPSLGALVQHGGGKR